MGSLIIARLGVDKEGLQRVGVFAESVCAFIGGSGEEQALDVDEDICEGDCGTHQRSSSAFCCCSSSANHCCSLSVHHCHLSLLSVPQHRQVFLSHLYEHDPGYAYPNHLEHKDEYEHDTPATPKGIEIGLI